MTWEQCPSYREDCLFVVQEMETERATAMDAVDVQVAGSDQLKKELEVKTAQMDKFKSELDEARNEQSVRLTLITVFVVWRQRQHLKLISAAVFVPFLLC